MPTNVVMPQMGESIFEGTITKWLKKAGDTVQRDEPLFEISTDKVDAEIPSPAAGVLTEIKIAEGATVEINTVVAVIAEDGSAAASTPAPPSMRRKKPGRKPLPPRQKRRKSPSPLPQPPNQSLRRAPPPPVSASAPAQTSGGTDVVMPQMGESIFEGTITKWLKKVGDTVARDEPLFEISTDKVDAEIPSPAAGVLTDIKVPEGSTVEINTIVAVIGGTAGAAASSPAAPAAPAEKKTASNSATGRHADSRAATRGSSDRRKAAFLAAGATHRQGKQPRPVSDSRHRSWRTHHQGRRTRLRRPARQRSRSRSDYFAACSLRRVFESQRQPRRKSRSPATWFRSARCAPSSPSAWWNRSTPAPTSTPSSRLT